MENIIKYTEALAHISTVFVLFISVWSLTRNSFNSMFTQLLANHNNIYKKVSAKQFHKFYEEFKKEFKHRDLIQADDIRDFYNRFTEDKENEINSAYLQAYFKFIYHEITIVKKSKCLKKKKKKFYVCLIQSQMSNEELFCYLINQIRHNSGKTEYKEFLKEMGFFNDLYDSKYRNDINKIKMVLLEPLIEKNLLD